MSDDPRPLKAVLLEDADDDARNQFAQLLAQHSAIADAQERDGLDWLFIPTPTEYERMRKYTQPPDYDRCPKCKKGRLILTVHHGNIGDSIHVACKWGSPDCGFKEYVSDPA